MNELVAVPGRRLARRRGDRERARLLLVPAPQPGRQALAWTSLGPPEHAVGRHASCGWRTSAPDGSSRTSASWPAGPRSRSGSRSGRRTACCTTCPTASDWWNLYREGEDDAARGDGGRVRRAAVGVRRRRPTRSSTTARIVAAYVEDGRWNLGVIEHGRSCVTSALPYTRVRLEPGAAGPAAARGVRRVDADRGQGGGVARPSSGEVTVVAQQPRRRRSTRATCPSRGPSSSRRPAA